MFKWARDFFKDDPKNWNDKDHYGNLCLREGRQRECKDHYNFLASFLSNNWFAHIGKKFALKK